MMFGSMTMFSGFYPFMFVMIFIAILIANDASSRGLNGIGWGLIALFMPMLGIIIYIVFISSSNGNKNTDNDVSYRRRMQNNNSRDNYSQNNSVKSKNNIDPTTVYCIACGSENTNFSNYCNACGSEIPIPK